MSAPDEIKAVDFSFARVPAATLAANGVKHVFRYLAYLPNGKVITKPERDDDVAHGVTVHYNWETSSGRFLEPGIGDADGAYAAQLLAGLGDAGHVVICSLDTDPNGLTVSQLATVHANLQAFSRHCPVGIYGGAKIIDASAAWPEVRERWQTAAWSGGYLSPHADYYQRTGHSWSLPGVPADAYDEDVVIHPGNGAPTPPPEKPVLAPKYNVQLPTPIVDVLACPTGGVWILTADGAVWAFNGAPYLGGANGKPYFAGRIASRFVPLGNGYTIEDTAEEKYDFPAT